MLLPGRGEGKKEGGGEQMRGGHRTRLNLCAPLSEKHVATEFGFGVSKVGGGRDDDDGGVCSPRCERLLLLIPNAF